MESRPSDETLLLAVAERDMGAFRTLYERHAGWLCGCRKSHPCRLSSMLVLVEDAAEAVPSVDVEPGGGVWLGDRRGQGAQAVQHRARPPASSRSMTRFLAAWATHGCTGMRSCTRIPSAGVLNDRQHVQAPASQGDGLEKSQASRVSAWERRKLAQVAEVRSGAGSIPACCRISHTVEAAALTPRTSSSPWMRRDPARILPGQAQHQQADRANSARPARRLRQDRVHPVGAGAAGRPGAPGRPGRTVAGPNPAAAPGR
jgi:hypothetical protein